MEEQLDNSRTLSTPNSPMKSRRSLPGLKRSNSGRNSDSPLLASETRRSFRSKGRSSLSNSSDSPRTPTPFGSSFARSSLRSSLKKGSPSPVRKLTVPRGPNLATAGRNRTCNCSEVHHHPPVGQITPVDKRVPLEKERGCRHRERSLSRDANSSKHHNHGHGDNHGRRSRSSMASSRSSSARSSAVTSPERSSSSASFAENQSLVDSKDFHALVNGINKLSTALDDNLEDKNDGASETEEFRENDLGDIALLENKSDATNSGDGELSESNEDLNNSKGESDDDTKNMRKSSITTLVNWVPWLAEKRYYSTMRFNSENQPNMNVSMFTEQQKITQTSLPQGYGTATEIHHHYKIVHSSSSTSEQMMAPSFTRTIGAPHSFEIGRLTLS